MKQVPEGQQDEHHSFKMEGKHRTAADVNK